MNGTLAASMLSADDFPATGTPQEKLRFLLAYAILAPSSHNTQPWRFRLYSDYVELHADRTRALPTLDPQDRELLISCGAALGHLQVALRRYGYTGEVQAFPNPTNRDLLARIGLGAVHQLNAEDERLFQSLLTRHTNRKPFHPERIPADELAQLQTLPLPEQIWLKVVPDGECRNAMAELIAHADRDQVADCRFRREIAEWIRPQNASQPAATDGIPTEALGMPGLIANVGPFFVRTFDTGALFAARDRQLAINAPLLVVIGSEEDTPESWLRTGQALSNLLLSVTAEGIATSFLNSPIEVAELRPLVAEALSQPGFPQQILRLGYGDSVAPTPRRPLEDVIEYAEINPCP